MYNEVAPEFIVNQGLYYPTGTNYEYLSTALESPGNWEDHHRFFGLDGQEIQYTGVPNEGAPYVYYTPSYGYTQSAYNPYNPFIPGAMVAVDSPFLGQQQYSVPSYEHPVSSPLYIPMVVQSRPDIIMNTTDNPFIDMNAFISRAEGPAIKNNLSTKSSRAPLRSGPSQENSLTQVFGGTRANAGSSKQPMTHKSVSSKSFSASVSAHIVQGGVDQTLENVPNGKSLSNYSPSEIALGSGKGSSGFRAGEYAQTSLDKVRPKSHQGTALDYVKENNGVLTELDGGPSINKLKNELVVKAYTTTAGDFDSQGNIIIHINQYNMDDFPIDYMNAKFFVIKSYSEDDVHKSIKYNVWSSTPNGNKKLNISYEDAQRIAAGDSKGCPIFLFFSVNASGQFCGVAEMTGPVDFRKDMDFWQQDKWSGSFPVKWRIIKDVPNPNFRLIILENNENKPVTNSRDTQEIPYKKGMEMLKIFKNYISKTSLLDDFMFYENRQKILQEGKARMLFKSIENPYFIRQLNPPRKLAPVFDPSSEDKKVAQHDQLNNIKKNESDSVKPVSLDADSVNGKSDDLDELKIGLLTINPKEGESQSSVPASATGANELNDVESTPVNVTSSTEYSGFLTVGTIPLDPRVLNLGEFSSLGKNGSRNG